MIYMPRGYIARIVVRHPVKGYRVWRAWRAYKSAETIYCVCSECIRCGCGLWEAHHKSVSQVTKAKRRNCTMAIIRSFRCPACGKQLFTQRALAEHMRKAHSK